MLVDLKLGERYDGFLFLAESARNPPVIRPHHHEELELNLVKRGTITYVVEGHRFSFSQGTLLWMYPAQEHQLVHRSEDAEYYVAVFKPELIERSCRDEAYAGLKRKTVEEGGVRHTMLKPTTFDLLRRTMDELLHESLDPDLLNREAGFGEDSNFRFEHGDPDGLNAGLHHLLLQGWRCQRATQNSDGAVALHRAVRRALTLLSDTDCESSLGQLARKCGVSEAYLSRVFGRQMGVSLSRYRNSVRLGRFLEIYRGREQCTMTEAVYGAGFGSYAQFYKVFVQAYGQGPRASLEKPMIRG
jgi:AraC-like DNA-binding protein